MLNVMVTSPERVLYEGTAGRVIAPGEQGTFEVLPLHRPLVSRLLAGVLIVDTRAYAIERGVLSVADDGLTVVVELAARDDKP